MQMVCWGSVMSQSHRIKGGTTHEENTNKYSRSPLNNFFFVSFYWCIAIFLWSLGWCTSVKPLAGISVAYIYVHHSEPCQGTNKMGTSLPVVKNSQVNLWMYFFLLLFPLYLLLLCLFFLHFSILCCSSHLINLHQVGAGQIQSWQTSSCWWSWALRLSRPPPPVRSAPPTCLTRFSGATSSPPWSLCLHQANTWQTSPSLTKWPRRRPRPSSNRPAPSTDTRATGAGLCPMCPIQTRFVWSRATGREGRSVAALLVFASATCEQIKRLRWECLKARNAQKICIQCQLGIDETSYQLSLGDCF